MKLPKLAWRPNPPTVLISDHVRLADNEAMLKIKIG